MASPLPTPTTSPQATGPQQLLPPAPTKENTPKVIAQINRAIAQYYWPRHFECAVSCRPALFIDRLMTDYGDHEDDPLAEWLDNMWAVYKAYKACVKYGVENGSPEKAKEAETFQGVLNPFGC